MTSDNITVPAETDGDSVYCRGCGQYLGKVGCGEELEHTITQCLQYLAKRQRGISNRNPMIGGCE